MKDKSTNVPFTDLSRFELSSDEKHIQYEVGGKQTGYDTLYQLQPGVLLRIMHFKYGDFDPTPQIENEKIIYPKELIAIAFKLKGNHVMKVKGEDGFQLNEGFLTLAYSSNQIEIEEMGDASKEYSMVMLLCKPEVLLKAPFHLSLEQLPDCLQDVFTGKRLVTKTIVMNDSLMQALRALLNTNLVDCYSRPFLQAKSVELMCLALGNVALSESKTELSKLSKKEVEILKSAGVLLKDQWLKPPEQSELVKILGIGKSRLKKGFRLFYGCSMKEFITNNRLQQAQKLLLAGNLNVTQVALEVGYEHTSNFTSAFKNKFGISPKAFQTISIT